MKKTISVLNRMESEKVFERYAIGGGMACLFYMEPFVTFDLDIFVFVNNHKSVSGIVSLSPIYEWLIKNGYPAEKEQILIEGVPVQFIVAYNPLVEDAVKNSVIKKYDDVETHVFSADYLAAIMLQTGRPKDMARLREFIRQSDFNEHCLRDILIKNNLTEKISILEQMING